MARKPDSPSGRPIRRLARLNEGKLDPGIPAATAVDQGVFGHVLDRAAGERETTVYFDRQGNRYEELTTFSVGLVDHPLFMGTGDEIADYAEDVLTRYDLPRPSAPGMYWEDDATGGRLAWGPEAPCDLLDLDRIPFVGLYEPMAGKFVEENIDRWPECWEAPLASAYLDRWGQIRDELDRIHARFRDAAHDMNVSPLFGRERRSHRDPLAFPGWAFDQGYYFGRLIGELTEAWRLGLLHGRSLLHDHRRRDAASAAVHAATGHRRSEASAWKLEAVRLAAEVTSERGKTASDPLSTNTLATMVIKRAVRLSSRSALGGGGPSGEARQAALRNLATMKPDTVARVLRDRSDDWEKSSSPETTDDRSS